MSGSNEQTGVQTRSQKKNAQNSSAKVVHTGRQQTSPFAAVLDKEKTKSSPKDLKNSRHNDNSKDQSDDQEVDGINNSEDINDERMSNESESETDDYAHPPKTLANENNQKRFSTQNILEGESVEGDAPTPGTSANENNQKKSSKKNKLWAKIGIVLFVAAVAIYLKSRSNDTEQSATDYDWRSKVDPNDYLSNDHQSTIRASLKPILDESSMRQDEGVSTLLILSSDEETAAKLAQCLLNLVNKESTVNRKSTKIDLRSYSGTKSDLDSDLRLLLNTTNTVRAVLLRGINDIPSKHVLERLRLLFGYCDGENPVVPHRLIIMTASCTSRTENELRETFKNQLPTEHDFIDALMSRISGHTLYIEKDQKSIC